MKQVLFRFRILSMILVFMLLVIVSCKNTEQNYNQNSIVCDIKLNTDEIEFTLMNNTNTSVEFNNLQMFLIDKMEGGEWQRVPTFPCKCGVPCAQPPVPTNLKPNESVEMKWDFISRRCKGITAIEYKVEGGSYRIGVNYKTLEEGIIQEVGTFYKEFEL